MRIAFSQDGFLRFRSAGRRPERVSRPPYHAPWANDDKTQLPLEGLGSASVAGADRANGGEPPTIVFRRTACAGLRLQPFRARNESTESSFPKSGARARIFLAGSAARSTDPDRCRRAGNSRK